MIPGTSYLATVVLSLRDKSHSPIEAPHYQIPYSFSVVFGPSDLSPFQGEPCYFFNLWDG
jgi:hypothetical protein